jgi:hypothetical protein
LTRRRGLPKRSTRQSKSERGVVNKRNVCAASDKRRVDAARHRQQTLFEARAHTAALNRLETARRSSRRSACVTRREPWKLPSAPSSSRVSSRLQTRIVLSQRSLVKRATSGSA